MRVARGLARGNGYLRAALRWRRRLPVRWCLTGRMWRSVSIAQPAVHCHRPCSRESARANDSRWALSSRCRSWASLAGLVVVRRCGSRLSLGAVGLVELFEVERRHGVEDVLHAARCGWPIPRCHRTRAQPDVRPSHRRRTVPDMPRQVADRLGRSPAWRLSAAMRATTIVSPRQGSRSASVRFGYCE